MAYEAPTLTEIGTAEDVILGSGNDMLDADNETKMV